MAKITSRFPDPLSSKKDEDYHKQWVQAIVKESVDSNYETSVAFMDTLVDYYNGVQSSEAFQFVQEAEDGDALPAIWNNYNKIKVKIDLLLGELAAKGYEIRVKHVNSDASSRKLIAKRKGLAQMKLAQDVSSIDPDMGEALMPKQGITEREELEDYYEYDYREITEVIMEAAVKYCAKKSNLDYIRMSLFRDMLIFGRCHGKTEIINSMPVTRRIDPRNFIFDRTAEDDFLRTSTYFGEIRYMSVADAAEQYNLSKEEITKAYNNGEKLENIRTANSTKVKVVDGTNIAYYKTEDGELKVLVCTAVWQEVKPFNYKESKDKYGSDHLKFIGSKDKVKDDERLHKSHIKIWRQATLIGGETVAEWGEVENQVRNIEDPFDTPCPYFSCIPNYLNGKSVSITEQLKSLQDFKDVTLFNLQLQMTTAGGKGFVYDLSQTPDDWEPETVIKYLKTANIAFIQSKKDGTPVQFNQFQQIDMTLSQSIGQYIAINQLIDKEMDQITGINEARQGLVQNSSQTVGVTQSSLFQSNLTTKFKFDLFDQSISHALNNIAGLIKIAWEDKDVFAPIIGDVGIDFINESIDLELDDYGVFFEAIPQAVNDINSFQQIVMTALQSGQVSLVDGLKLLKEKEITPAIRRFERAAMRQEEKMAKRQQEAVAAAEQAKLQQIQAQNQGMMQQQAQRDGAAKDLAMAKMQGEIIKQQTV